jgi:hypothetical protein
MGVSIALPVQSHVERQPPCIIWKVHSIPSHINCTDKRFMKRMYKHTEVRLTLRMPVCDGGMASRAVMVDVAS